MMSLFLFNNSKTIVGTFFLLILILFIFYSRVAFKSLSGKRLSISDGGGEGTLKAIATNKFPDKRELIINPLLRIADICSNESSIVRDAFR